MDGLVTVAEFETTFEAEIAKMELEANEINAFVAGDNLMSVIPSVGYVKVQLLVKSEDLEKAKSILEASSLEAEDDQQEGV